MENQTESFRHEHGYFFLNKQNKQKKMHKKRKRFQKKCQSIDFIQGPHFILPYYAYSFAITRDKQI